MLDKAINNAPIVQPLAPYSIAGCCAVLGAVPVRTLYRLVLLYHIFVKFSSYSVKLNFNYVKLTVKTQIAKYGFL